MGVRWKANDRLPQDIKMDHAVTALVYQLGADVYQRAVANASSGADTGAFASSIEKSNRRGMKMNPYVRVSATLPGYEAVSIEFGTKHTEPKNFLRRAIKGIRQASTRRYGSLSTGRVGKR